MKRFDNKYYISSIKKAYSEKGLTQLEVLEMVKENGFYPISASTLSRILADGSENASFNFERSIFPLYDTLCGIDDFDEGNDENLKVFKTILKLKDEQIKELKVHYSEKLESEYNGFKQQTDFLNHQIELKDQRIDDLIFMTKELISSVKSKDDKHDELLKLILDCPARKKMEDCS